MNPSLFIAVICGGLVGNFMFQLMDCGLVAMASPGSLFAIIALAPKQRLLQILIGIILSAITSFLISGIFLSRKKDWEEEMDEEGHRDNESLFKDYRGNYNIKKIVFACDAGMGSSAMGASLLGKLFYDRGLQVKIDNVSIEDLPEDADVIVTYKNLVNRTRKKCPLALHVGINDFLDRGYYDHVVEALISQCEIKEDSMDTMKPTAILMKKNIILNKAPVSKSEAIVYAGELLVESGYVEAPYIEGMLAREEKFTTFIGKGVAIPHGENAVKDKILASGIVVVQYPGGVDFGEGNIANLVIGIAGKGNEHLEILANIAEAIEEDELLNKMITTTSVDEIYAIFAAEGLLEA
jgi:PTS system mannitol-specific IIC component